MNSDMPPMPPKLNGWGPSLSKSYQCQMIDKKYVKSNLAETSALSKKMNRMLRVQNGKLSQIEKDLKEVDYGYC